MAFPGARQRLAAHHQPHDGERADHDRPGHAEEGQMQHSAKAEGGDSVNAQREGIAHQPKLNGTPARQ